MPSMDFRQPARAVKIVLGCVVLALIALVIAGCSSGEQGRQGTNSATPAVASSPAAATRPAPVTGPVALPSEIRDAQVKTLDGSSLKLSDYDKKVVVLNIWATWCGPCRLEMPDLVKLNNEYKSRGLVVLGLATTYNERNDQAHVKEFIKTQKVDYRILWDDGTLAAPLVQIMGGRSVIPQSFVISRDGRVVKHFQGFNQLSTPALMRQAVEEALSDKGKA
ncbi:MAG TPA: TlpA disulfide reductase family protein [Pyrinomonadaceae bacterium]|nr:TlpA disulfide reductase family protein [Pyrinomonadaceae bacterium]